MTMRLFLILLASCAGAMAQRTLETDRSVVSQVRIDARELGYPPADVIPGGESAVTALTVAPGGQVYGATSGKRSHLFVLDPRHGYVQPLGHLSGVTAVRGTLAAGANGDIYIGAGRLLRFTPRPDQAAMPIRIDAACEAQDLGAPVEGESIHAMAAGANGTLLYGITHPSGHFFRYGIAEAKFSLHGRVAERRMPGEKFETDLALGRALIEDRNGSVFTSGEGGALVRFDPATQRLERLGLTVPTVPGREAYSRVDAWTIDSAGTLFGGSSDGYLFRFDPKTLRLDNLGKPLNQYRIRGLVVARNRKLYGVGGDDGDMARLFSYDPARGAYEVLGFIDVNRRPYYMWQAYTVGAMTVGRDGTVYLGQSERKSMLYLYYPE